ncbi:amino acid ABC transporter ATP-binding protein [Parasutterella secunda]|uniref:Amino acid ABC transporter ATP-binding protein n=1 Tax=Parasutterella secunda TaxID=626947 RepID=A0ABS2GTD8_9BURK|nr:amino acid ABC transporter ATP-binding protein [Parasutterella secunda]MBM6929113.1 amino acid ABC transporter ATP-binding protein [Parasutterella secunda]
MIEVKNLRKSFGEVRVLKGVGLTIEKGDVISIIGPSGSGKTTLLRCMNFLESADLGEMVFDGQTFDMSRMHRKDVLNIRKKTAFVFQNYNLFFNKTALENVTEGLVIGRGMAKDKATEIGRRLLNRVGLAERETYYPSELSGGQQQRVAIARALAVEPEIIYFDEPTSALDPELTQGILSLMRELADDGMTMLVVTHEMGFAKNVSNKVCFMDQGQMVEMGPAKEFFNSPKDSRSKAFLRTAQDS